MNGQRARVMKLLSVVNGSGLSAAEIGDICGIGSADLDPLLLRLIRHQRVKGFWDGERIARRRLYRLGPKAEDEAAQA